MIKDYASEADVYRFKKAISLEDARELGKILMEKAGVHNRTKTIKEWLF